MKVVAIFAIFACCQTADIPPAPKSYKQKAAGAKGGMTAKEAQGMLDIVNKMRCTVGSPAIQWNADLASQAQASQETHGMEHDKAWLLKIPATENLCGYEDLSDTDLGPEFGEPMAHAAWAWFLEYTLGNCNKDNGDCGHYKAMTWTNTREIGCGIQRDGSGKAVRCQFANQRPSFLAGLEPEEFAKNVHDFKGPESAYKKCGIDFADVKKAMATYTKWKVTHPKAPWGTSLMYDASFLVDTASPHGFLGGLFAGFLLAAAVVGAGTLAVRRLRRTTQAQDQDHELMQAQDQDHELLQE